MTGEVGILLALAAGLLLAERRQVVKAVAIPFAAVLVIQTWAIHAGHGVSPPDTVTEGGYWLVQALIFGCTVGIAVQLSALRFRGVDPVSSRLAGMSRTALAYCAGGGLAALVVVGSLVHLVVANQWTGVHHSSSGSPPLLGLLGILALVLGFVGLGCVSLWQRRSRPRLA
jgi:peptidoglycan/LPS O-acetylase OafA/YrhL